METYLWRFDEISFENVYWIFIALVEIPKRHFNGKIYATWWKNMKT